MARQKSKIYVDGSYNPTTNIIGCAVILVIETSKRPHRIAYRKELKSHKLYGSNIAEMSAVKTAVRTACSLGVTNIAIYYDWDGIEFFSHRNNIKKRHSLCPYFAVYADYIEKAKKKNIKIVFIKVKAHSGNELNSLADKMARLGKTI
jgi:ribonuclease HI